MRDSQAQKAPSDGLSRRGWLVLVSVTAAVLVVAAGAAAFALGLPAGHAGPATSSPPAGAARPQLDPAPTPLGLPARPTPSPAPSATVPSRPLGTLAAGDCLQTYTSKSEAAYPVIDCASPHIAQLLSKGTLPQAAGAAFPGKTALDEQVGDLCEQHLDWAWVGVWNEDVQVDLRYADTPALWSAGDRSYYCFVYTYSRHELTGSAVAG
ncbi:septum formation family protein [Leifsonia shinshuensis]|uniref:septum formation family protein n=1 Tax=Leifsonia shinshuensis TaxID=150026 RepID=UPI001F5143D4|nr:septum formation family protein [Leifsonia shinshuensis]MCI0155409.1 septum formation family protein [Leifsonia shinshuensis]